MTRKLTTVAVVLVLLIAVCTLEQLGVRRITDEAMGMTHGIMQAIREGEWEQAKEKAHALDRTWDRQAKLLEMLVDHGSTDDVRYALSRLIAALEGEDNTIALIYAGELEGGIEHVMERQALTLENML